jgi:predicted anti-sigma-YlaC factor YlaD
MRCDEVKEHIIDFIYDERGMSPENIEIQEHLRLCPACREEFEEMTQARKYLQRWQDEPPLRSVTLDRKNTLPNRSSGRKHMHYAAIARYAAIAAMIFITILALANTQISWNKNGFSFSTHLLPGKVADRDYYTKAELRNLLKEVLDDSESRMNEVVYLMMQETLKTVDKDRWMDLSMIRSHAIQNQNN